VRSATNTPASLRLRVGAFIDLLQGF
jgi:hypothetical protein